MACQPQQPLGTPARKASLRNFQIVNSDNTDLVFRVPMLTFEVSKGRRVRPGPSSLFFSPAFGFTSPGFGFSKPSPEFSTRRVKNFARRVVASGPGLGISGPGFVNQIDTKCTQKG